MTDPADNAAATTTGPAAADVLPTEERRLHPLSWLFVLIASLKQFVLPLLILVIFGGRDEDRYELIGALGVIAVLVVASVWRYFTYRYRVGDDSLQVRSGVFERSLREIPFSRIHNVALHQSLLHRLFGVAEVRLESAGGTRPEAEMRVLRMREALALEALVRRHARAAGEDAATDQATGEDPGTLLELSLGEVIRHGLISNRGMVVIGAGFAAISQVNPDLVGGLIERWATTLLGSLDLAHMGFMQYLVGGLSLALGFVLLLQGLSVALSLMQYYRFRLLETGPRLTTERGLLTRIRTSAARRRIQAWTLREGLLQRLYRRRSLQVDTASSRYQSEQRAFRDLAPVARPERCDALIRHLLPDADWPLPGWQPLHPRAWWRMALPGVTLGLLAAALLGWRWGAVGLFGLLWIPWALLVAHRNGQRAGYAINDELVAVREGWWSRHWRFAEIDKLQVLRLRRSPLDRRTGMASLWLDTAGAGSFAPPLRIRFMSLDQASALQARLSVDIARRPLRW